MRLQIWEKGGQTGKRDARDYDRQLKNYLKHSLTSKSKIQKYYRESDEFQQLPGDGKMYQGLGLLDLVNNTNKSVVQKNSTTFLKHLQLAHFEPTPGDIRVRSKNAIPILSYSGKLSNVPIRGMFPKTEAGFWATVIQEFLRRAHPLCADDAPSYQPNPNATAPNPYIDLHPPQGADHFMVEIFELDEYGLVKADGTGVRLIWCTSSGRQKGNPVVRAHGEEVTGDQYDNLAQACAVIRTALAVARRHKLDVGLTRFFQKPPALNKLPPNISEPEVMPFDQDLFDWGKADLDNYVREFKSVQGKPNVIWPVIQQGQVAVPSVDHGHVPLPFLPPTGLPNTLVYGYIQAMTHHAVRGFAHSRTIRHVRPVLGKTWAQRGDQARSLINFGCPLPCGLELHTLLDSTKETFWSIFLDLSEFPVAADRWRFHQAIELGLQTAVLEVGKPAWASVDAAPDGRPKWTIRLDLIPHPCPSQAFFQSKGYDEKLVVVRGNPRDPSEIQRGPTFNFRLPDPVVLHADYHPAPPVPLRPLHLEQLVGMDLAAEQSDEVDVSRPADVENTFCIAGLGQELVRWMGETLLVGVNSSRLDYARE